MQKNTLDFGTEKISRILLRMAPPVMLALLIQALYNVVDSYFVGKFSDDALTALSVVFPMQFLIIAIAVGTGVGVNTYMARKYALGRKHEADATAGTGMVLAVLSWAVFAAVSALVMRPFVCLSASSPEAVSYAVTYGDIVCIGSLGAFLEGTWSKVHQAGGNMKLPMLAQVTGAVINVVLDPILIFGVGGLPAMGVAGAAVATVLGQTAAAVITGIRGARRPPRLRAMGTYARKIYLYGYSSIVMQALCSVYIVGLNMILGTFSDAAVTVLGLYYKLQNFFFIPLFGLQTCIVPLLSYNCAAQKYERCRETIRKALLISASLMLVGAACFILLPGALIGIFSRSAEVLAIGRIAFPIIGASFPSAAFSLIMPVFFQAVGCGGKSLAVSLTRQIFGLLPVFWLLSLIGLNYTWLAFPIAETAAGALGYVMYRRQLKMWKI